MQGLLAKFPPNNKFGWDAGVGGWRMGDHGGVSGVKNASSEPGIAGEEVEHWTRA